MIRDYYAHVRFRGTASENFAQAIKSESVSLFYNLSVGVPILLGDGIHLPKIKPQGYQFRSRDRALPT